MHSLHLSPSRVRRSSAYAALLAGVMLTACEQDERITSPAQTAPNLAVGAPLTPRPNCLGCGGPGKILFTRSDPNAGWLGHIWVMNADTTGKKQLTSGNWDDDYAAWSPDYTKIVFSSNRRGNRELFVMNADGTNVTPITTSVRGSHDVEPTWAPDGSKIFFVRSSTYKPIREIDAVKPDGTGLQVIRADSAMLIDPTVSPNGQKIAVVRWASGSSPAIYLMNLDGTGFTQFTYGSRGDAEPAWSPDGSTLIFTCNFTYTDIRNVCAVNANGGGRRTVIGAAGSQENPSFSRDGTHIVYESWDADPYARLFIAKADGSEQMQVQPYLDLMANYNPTGSR